MPMLATTKQAEANPHCPSPTSAVAAVAATPRPVKRARSSFLAPSASAATPSSGDSTATTTSARVVALAWRMAAAPSGAPAAA